MHDYTYAPILMLHRLHRPIAEGRMESIATGQTLKIAIGWMYGLGYLRGEIGYVFRGPRVSKIAESLRSTTIIGTTAISHGARKRYLQDKYVRYGGTIFNCIVAYRIRDCGCHS